MMPIFYLLLPKCCFTQGKALWWWQRCNLCREVAAAAVQPVGFMYFITVLKNQRADLTALKQVWSSVLFNKPPSCDRNTLKSALHFS